MSAAARAADKRNASQLILEHQHNKGILGMSRPDPTLTQPAQKPPPLSINSAVSAPSPTDPHHRNYLSNLVDDLLPKPLHLHSPDRHYPENWLSYVQLIVNLAPPTPLSPTVKFEVSKAAAQHNEQCLIASGYDVEALIQSNAGTTMSHGSEFRDPTILHILLHDHPLWPYMRGLLEHGAEFTFKVEPTDSSRLTENTDLLEYKTTSQRKTCRR